MKTTLIALAVLSSACATARVGSRFDDLSDREIARLAVRETLGELHQVEDIDAVSREVKRGTPAFANREERVAFDERLDQALRSKLSGQAPVLDQFAASCTAAQQREFAVWPKERFKSQAQCAWADASVSLHSLWKKPRLQRIYLDTLLELVGDPDFSLHAHSRFEKVSNQPREAYVFKLGAWDSVEGFRPRG